MADPSGISPSKYHLLFSRKPPNSGNIAFLSSISSIWEDNHIEKLENNQWKCLWCDFKFKGINATKSLARVIETKCIHIKRYTASIDQVYLSRYKQLQQIKTSNKGLLNDYSQKMISSVSRLQDKSSEVVELYIQRNSRGMHSSNITVISDTSSFITFCGKSPESNPATPQKGSIFLMGDNYTQKIMTSNETCLTVAIADLVISGGLSFNISQKPRFKKVLDFARTVSKSY